MQTNQSPALEGDKWPDFYAILDAQPELDDKELRRIIGERYQQASNKMDHRDLSVRFYNQVLTQKVLPACRRILLNPEMRTLYDEQLRLHRNGATDAISYHKFVVEVTLTKSTCLLDSNELSILPSIDGESAHSPLRALNVAGKPPQRVRTETEAVTVRMQSSVPVAAPPTAGHAKSKSPVPLAAIAGVAVLLLGAGGWFMTRPAPEASTGDAVAPSASGVASAVAAAPNKETPSLLKLNTLATNSDFEDKDSAAWTIATKDGSAFADDAFNNDAKSGRRVLNFWTKDVPVGQPSRKARVTQQITNLENGTYTLKAWVRRAGKQKEFYMFANDYGGPTRRLNINLADSSGWKQLTLSNIKVTKGQCTIGFYCDNVKDWVNIDAVEFYRS